MSGYNAAHGDTEAVRLSLDNERELSERYRAIIDNHVRWDGQSWNGIAKAAAGLHTYVKTVRTRTPEIADADLDAVQWTSIVALQIQEANLEAGRGADAGLTHYVAHGGKPVTAVMSEADCQHWISENTDRFPGASAISAAGVR